MEITPTRSESKPCFWILKEQPARLQKSVPRHNCERRKDIVVKFDFDKEKQVKVRFLLLLVCLVREKLCEKVWEGHKNK